MRHRVRSGVAVAAGVAGAVSALLGAAPLPPGVERLLVVQDPRIAEASGLAAGTADGLLFVHEDAGRPPALYALDPGGALSFVVDVPGVENLDWEDVATGTDDEGRPALFLADTGNAAATLRPAGRPARTEFSLVRLAEPRAPAQPAGAASPGTPPTVPAQDVVTFPLTYADGRPRDAEALAVQPGTNRVLVVDKVDAGDRVDEVDAGDRVTRLWAAPEQLVPDAPNVLSPLAELPVVQVSGAAFSPDGRLLAVRTATTAHIWPVDGADVAAAVRAAPVDVDLPRQRQGESIAFSRDGSALLVGSEGVRQPVFTVPLPPGVAPSPSPSPLQSATSAGDGISQPAAAERGSPDPVTWALGAATALVACLLAWQVLRSRRGRP